MRGYKVASVYVPTSRRRVWRWWKCWPLLIVMYAAALIVLAVPWIWLAKEVMK